MSKSKIIAIILSLTLIFTSVLVPDNGLHAEPNPYFYISSYEDASEGETVSVNLYMYNNPGITVAYLTVSFPEQLICTGVEDAKILKEFNAPGSLEGNTINLYWSDDLSTVNNTVARACIATLTFKVKEGTPDGEYPITISVPDTANIGKYIYDKDLNGVPFTFTNGSVIVDSSYSGGGSGYSGGGYSGGGYSGGGGGGKIITSDSDSDTQKNNSTKTTVKDALGNTTVKTTTKIDDNTTKTVSEKTDKDGNFISKVEETVTKTEDKTVTETITTKADETVNTSTVTVEKSKTTTETLQVSKDGIYTYSKTVENSDNSKTSISVSNKSGKIIIIKNVVNSDNTQEKIKYEADSEDDKTLSIINAIIKETTLHIPGSVKANGVKRTVDTIEDEAFSNLKKLKEVFINKSITNFGENIFSNCRKLKNIHLYAKSLKNLKENTFAGLRKNVTFSISAKTDKQYKKAVKKIKKAGAPKTAKFVRV